MLRLVLYKSHYISFLKDKNERVSSMYLPTLLLSKLAESSCDKYIIEGQDPLDYWKTPILQNQCLNASIKTTQGELYKKVDKALRGKKMLSCMI